MSWYSDVGDFHKKFGLPITEPPGFRLTGLRMRLIEEEIQELKDAANIEDAADAIGDAIYVLIGAAITWGIPLDKVWDEIHASNMRKIGGPTRDDGKILKPAGWVGPNIKGAIYGKE